MAQETSTWIKEKTLGSGGFGCVILWKDKVTGKALAIKECRWPKDATISPKNRGRWELEVQIMKKLSHPNIVTAVEVPVELNVSSTEMPLLAMEYCSLGDLRKVLNKPENCCGLSELEVRTLLQNVSSAIQYLHSRKIVHRDLKPENIVLQELGGKTAYKLIDLGYAKELDQGSLCTSFVGTVQYLAPELFLSQEYSSTVDHWSLGLVTHECITGVRPFLPEMTPAQWMPLICKKKSHHICVYTMDDGKPCYSDKLFPENFLSTLLLKDLEGWLQIMLDWDPIRRGTEFKDGSKVVVAFKKLDEILSKKIAQVFNVADGSLLTYEIQDTTTVDDLRQQILNDIKLQEQEVEFLLPRGLPPDKRTILQNWNQPEEDEWMLFVYPKNFELDASIKQEPVLSVNLLITEKLIAMSPQGQLKAWSHAVYFLKKETMRLKRFLQAQQILTKNLLYQNSRMNKISSEVIVKMKELQAVYSFFQESVSVDSSCYYEQIPKGGITSPKWENSFKYDGISKKLSLLQTKVSEIENIVHQVSSKTLEMQRSQFSRNKIHCGLDDLVQNASKAYDDFKRKLRDTREPLQNIIMKTILISFIKQKSQLRKQCVFHLKDINKYKEEVLQAVIQLEEAGNEIALLLAKIKQMQEDRQKFFWKVLDNIVKKLSHSKAPATAQQATLPVIPPFNFRPEFANELTSLQSSTNNFGGTNSLSSTSSYSISSIVNKTAEECHYVRRQNQQLVSRVQDASLMLTSPLTDDLDWNSILSANPMTDMKN